MTEPLSDVAAKMSGGELPAEDREAALKLAALIRAEADVFALHALVPVPGKPGRWLFMIETPFVSFPKFVIGETDTENDAPELLLKTGAHWNAAAEWPAILSKRSL